MRFIVASIMSAALAGVARGQNLSNVFGSHMVLDKDAPLLWGWAAAGTSVKCLAASGLSASGTADSSGVWRCMLPAVPAGHSESIITFIAADVFANITDVLFGHVFLCSGQSNMQFTTDSAFNATAEIAAANGYPLIRVLSVGQGTTSYTPLNELGSIAFPWAVASSASIGVGNWSSFSAVCWFTGRNIFNALGGSVPIGLISSNWGGTTVKAWSSAAALAKCNITDEEVQPEIIVGGEVEHSPAPLHGGPGQNNNSVLYNAMINPFVVGPMTIRGFTWYQAEADAGNPSMYACVFPEMISNWRLNFQQGNTWFGFVLLEPWIGASAQYVRDSQLKGLALPNVTMASAIDIGDPTGPWGSVHPRHKQPVGERLAAGAAVTLYGSNVQDSGPTYAGATMQRDAITGAVSVSVSFQPGSYAGGLQLVEDFCPTSIGVPIAQCVWPTVFGNDGQAYNSTLSINGDQVVFTPITQPTKPGWAATGTSYAYGIWPINWLYSGNFPAVPWNATM